MSPPSFLFAEEALLVGALSIEAGPRVPGLPALPGVHPDDVADDEARADRAERGGQKQEPADGIALIHSTASVRAADQAS